MNCTTVRWWRKGLPVLPLVWALGCGNANDNVQETPPKKPISEAHCLSGELAMGYVTDMVGFGPRHAGAPGLERTRAYIVEKLRSFGLEPQRREFTAYTPHPELKQVQMANITVDIPGPGPKKVLIGGHYDAKLLEDVDDFQGANDSGSSTALMLEMARCLKAQGAPCPVQLVFFDGEEAMVKWTDSDSLYGSKRFAGEVAKRGGAEEYAAAVIVDMIGDKRLALIHDTQSDPRVFGTLKATAESIGLGDLFKGHRGGIEDDHLPLLSIGIPTAVLIDLKYGPGWNSNSYWHTAKDTLDKISPKSMVAVGRVVLKALPELASHRQGPTP